ncbi:AraC family transcriptional regulator [Paraburkholderia silvatlantica]|uniref:AraC-like DNA-binding protein n=1 Tax=Paraburkholderia silvatlantica TaxID=321895 RepID=A0A2V4T3N7_9BURK|nr:AraC family transcriptional regulator [Paraburkholderia silvatlantica]PYE14137.1 AraC-like DNA-binding protein [Paraburkholderia silvatlantica]TDR04971.1 AraC-like DNA-binding protein [Paraburkholderia silvatlantica]
MKSDRQPSLVATQEATTIGGYCTAIAKTLQASGIDSERIFRSVGVQSHMANGPMVRLPVATLTRLYRACVEATNNPYFGLSVARHIHISNLHALGYALAASSTLLDFCRRLERHFRLVSQSATVLVIEEGDNIVVRATDFRIEVCGETEDAFVGFLVQTMRMLYKPGFNPLSVEFHRPMPREGDEPYRALLRAPVSFSNQATTLTFDKHELMQPLGGACPELAQVNDNIANQYLARLDKSDVVTAVTQKIIELLPSGDCSREKVAEALCVSPSTLQVRLAQRGTNFLQIMDDTRRELACNYIQQRTGSVTEIAFLLGFTSTSNFARAFKRWTGISPTQFRDDPPEQEVLSQ